jgi:hypothetical protein
MARNEALRRELIARAARPAAPDNADRLWSILDDYESWPGFRLVDPDGEHAAWLIAQLGDPDLQRRCLEHLDRVRMAEGRPQVYGSQWVVNENGELAPWPIENPGGVDVRRERVGLQPLAMQRAVMQSEYAQHGAPEWPVTSPPPRN